MAKWGGRGIQMINLKKKKERGAKEILRFLKLFTIVFLVTIFNPSLNGCIIPIIPTIFGPFRRCI